MAIDITTGEPAYPLTMPTIRRLDRLSRRVGMSDLRNRPQRRRTTGVALGLMKGILDDELAPSGTADVSIWRLDENGDEADSGDTLQDVRPWMMLVDDDPIPSGTMVVCGWIDGAWYVIAAACESGNSPVSEGDHYLTPEYASSDYFSEDYFHD